MPTVSRTIVREPSNSKCPGASRHVSLADKKFAVRPEDRGTGLAVVEHSEGAATIKMGGSFARGSGRTARMERKQVEIAVIVTGVETDTVTGIVDGGSQQIEILFAGVRRAS